MHFLLILLPVFSIFIVGYIAQLKLGFDTATLSKMSLYVLLPFLSFKTFYTHPLTIDYLYYTIYIVVFTFLLISFVFLWSVIMKYNITEMCALILSSCFMNNGNYGSPVIQLVFLSAGFNIAVIMIVLQQFIMTTVGLYFAAKGSESHLGERLTSKQVWARVLKMPVVYGALLGILFEQLHIPLSDGIIQSVSMLGDSSIVIIMVILGMQLATIKLSHIEYSKISFALLTKMVISPIIAAILVQFIPLDHLSKQVLIVLAAMPSAANTTLLAVQFNTQPHLVSTATLISTVLSLVTLPIVLNMVGA